jgi:hypothetical protein
VRIPLQGNADYAGVSRDIADDLAVLGLIAYAPTNASTQGSGTGATAWRINLTPGEVQIGGYYAAFDAQADYAVHGTTEAVDASGSVYARLVAKLVGSAVSLDVVLGTSALTGSEVAPTDAEVQTELGSTVDWCDIAMLHLMRDATTTLTQTQHNGQRTKTLKI